MSEPRLPTEDLVTQVSAALDIPDAMQVIALLGRAQTLVETLLDGRGVGGDICRDFVRDCKKVLGNG